MLKFVHKGRTLNLPLDKTSLTGDAEADSKLAYITGLVGGRVVSITSSGVKLADNLVANGNAKSVIGFLVNDAAGYFYENKPALASGLVSVARGPENVIQTDQIDTSLTFAIGDALYVGTGAKAGLLVNVDPTASTTNVGIKVGIALSAASVSSPTITVALV